jgi:hypothetical protein
VNKTLITPLQKLRQSDIAASAAGGLRITEAVIESQVRYNDLAGANYTATPQSGNFEAAKADLAWALAVERDMKEKGVADMRRTPPISMAGHIAVRTHPQLPADMGDHLRYHDRDTAPVALLTVAEGKPISL